MPLARQQAEALATLLTTLRPGLWDYPGCFAAMKKLAHRSDPVDRIIAASVAAALDPDVRSPMVIPSEGSHWHTVDKPAPAPRLTAEHECERHAGQWAGTCAPCHAEKLGGQAYYDLDPATVDTGTSLAAHLTDGYDPSSATLADAMRHEARAAAHAAATRNPTGHNPRTVHVITDLKPKDDDDDQAGAPLL